ncbi:hypothetical protein HPG69_009811 [Diceros bicornis minor]|uniref:Uncharacterized protein n=1 Tax=Diceros bicornis minor TaxID=77932 RepID=A0A7J7EVG6_DICBM|nr:hypothetical protein HPG69_009811 [Diceros bicornis minor]
MSSHSSPGSAQVLDSLRHEQVTPERGGCGGARSFGKFGGSRGGGGGQDLLCIADRLLSSAPLRGDALVRISVLLCPEHLAELLGMEGSLSGPCIWAGSAATKEDTLCTDRAGGSSVSIYTQLRPKTRVRARPRMAGKDGKDEIEEKRNLESSSFIEDTVWYFWNTVSNEELQLLLTDDEAWETFVAEADLSRDEADTLHEGLNTDQLNWKFLKEFPQVKWELEESIGKLQVLADKIDKVQGLHHLQRLGAEAAVTSVSTSIVDSSNGLSAKVKASCLVSIDIDKREIVEEALHHITPCVVSSTKNFTPDLEIIGKDICAIKLKKCKPLLAAPVKCPMTVGTISV